MKVRDLIKELTDLPQNAEVILSTDPEGNGFYELQDVDLSRYVPGDYDLLPVYPEDVEQMDGIESIDELTQAVYLWP